MIDAFGAIYLFGSGSVCWGGGLLTFPRPALFSSGLAFKLPSIHESDGLITGSAISGTICALNIFLSIQIRRCVGDKEKRTAGRR